ncbi:hypothetical protein [Frigoriglobus tundricola]|uniref:hypothetical protein n=1 Tax=Frigoriglobus tundricola TaxID=2774151 RepID=UPI00148ECE14|nr:hypothetical protein [Frigoriglobus tundricola]
MSPTRPEPRTRRPDLQRPEELAARLARAGIDLSVRNRPLLTRPNRTAVELSDDLPGEPATVFVYHCLDDADAREQAQTMGAPAFACGRFAIGTRGGATTRDRELLARIETVLNQPIGMHAITLVE